MPLSEFLIQELNLDLLNIRIGRQTDQRSAIQAMIADQKQKLVNLALDIIDMGGLSPGEPIWVTVDTDNPGKQIVLEGNRRIAALKIMENPRLAEGTEVYTSFVQLGKDFTEKPIRKIEGQVFASREEAWPWIERRHMGAASGVALQRWRSLAKERSRAGGTGSVRRSLLVLDFLDDGTDEFGDVGDVIEAKSTTVDRVLNNPNIKDLLGITINRTDRKISFDNGDELAGRRLLRNLIAEMAKPDFKFSKIRDETDRLNFIRGFADQSVHGSGTAENPETKSPAPQEMPQSTSSRKSRLTDPIRSTLAPRTGPRTIANVQGLRLNRIYRECREIKLDGNENAAAFLLRVFLELSSEAFLIEKSISIPAKHSGKKVYWGEFGITLEDKINAVMPIIDTTPKTKQQLKPARIAIADKEREGSIDTLHAYLHNLNLTPSPEALRAAWDTWEMYLTLLHTARR